MARILFAWELGAGLGHLANIAPLATGLRSRGHDVLAAVADPAAAADVLGEVPFVASPKAAHHSASHIWQPGNFAEILHNVGWSHERSLASLIQAWRHLFQLVRPQVVVLDHSPTALLALHGYRAACVQIGSGLCCPPDVAPLPDLCPWQNNYPDRLEMTEQHVLRTANACLAALDYPPLPRLSALMRRAEETILATFRELDHYSARANATYCGVWSAVHGAAPEWPDGTGPRVFAYLRRCERLGESLAALAGSPAKSIVYLADGDQELRGRFARGNVRFPAEPLDMRRVVSECDLAMNYASHGTVAQCLLAGKPIVAVANHNEQLINARNVEALGAGVCVSHLNSIHVADALTMVLNDPRYARGARAFADQYAEFDPQQQVERILGRLERLAHDV